MIKFEAGSSGGPIQESHVKKIEQSTGVPLPKSYLEFMAISNGGIPVRRILDVDGMSIAIERFLYILADYKTNDLGDYDIAVVHSQIFDRLNDYLSPFVSLFAGNFLCLDSEGRDEPRVVLWDHERSDVLAPVVKHVADSFEDFVKLHEKYATE